MKAFSKLVKYMLAATFIASGLAGASEADLKAELADMKAKMAAMESSLAVGAGGGGGGEASNLQSMKGKGTITVGGDVAIDIMFRSRDDWTSDHDAIDSTEFHTNSANLRFKIASSPTSYLYIKLDLDDFWNDEGQDQWPDQDDLLEECKFVWKNIRGSNFSLIFGKGEAPYGQDKTIGIIQSYNHDHSSFRGHNVYSSEGPVFLVAAEGVEDQFELGTSDTQVQNPHIFRGNTAHPGEVDNVFLMQVNYTWKNIVQAQLAIFQNNDFKGVTGVSLANPATFQAHWFPDGVLQNLPMTRAMHEDRPDDNLLFQSIAGRIWFLPNEELTLELSFINMHSDSHGDHDLYTRGESDQEAISFGFDYKLKHKPIELFGEYQHGFNWNYTKQYYTDSYQLGLIWGLTSNIDMGMMGEYLRIHHEMDNNNKEAYTKFVINGKYKFETGIEAILEYGYEYYNGEVAGGGDDDRTAHVLAFRTAWSF